jgi:hypothetical protein
VLLVSHSSKKIRPEPTGSSFNTAQTHAQISPQYFGDFIVYLVSKYALNAPEAQIPTAEAHALILSPQYFGGSFFLVLRSQTVLEHMPRTHQKPKLQQQKPTP